MHPTVPEFVDRSDRGESPMGLAPDLPWVLEVTSVWEDWVVDTLHRRGDDLEAVVIGDLATPVPDGALPLGRPHPLVRRLGDRWVARIPDEWDAEIEDAEGRRPLAAWVAEGRARRDLGETTVTLVRGARLWVDAGGVVVLVHLVRRAAWLDLRTEERDPVLPLWFGGLGFFAALFAVLAWTSPPPTQTTAFEVDERLVTLMARVPDPPPPLVLPGKGPAAGGSDEAPPDAEPAGGPNDRPGTSGHSDEDVVQSSGLFSAWEGSGLDAIDGPGTAVTEAIGRTGGRPTGHRGPGGGGTCCGNAPWGTGPDLDGPGTGTHGVGGGDHGFGTPDGDDRSPFPGFEIPNEVITLGCLERSVVDDVVKAHLPAIRYCYQRVLPRDPTMAGKVTVRFSIAKDGGVSSAITHASTLGNAEVEECLNDRFMRMTFPKPRGCTQVIVRYPFVFFPE